MPCFCPCAGLRFKSTLDDVWRSIFSPWMTHACLGGMLSIDFNLRSARHGGGICGILLPGVWSIPGSFSGTRDLGFGRKKIRDLSGRCHGVRIILRKLPLDRHGPK
jgi:hypothetical protein